MNLAVDQAIFDELTAALLKDDVVLVQTIQDELEDLADTSYGDAKLAAKALDQLGWLKHKAVVPKQYFDEVFAIQIEIAGTRRLRYPSEHLGESAIITVASKAQQFQPRMLSDDYDARIAAFRRGIQPFSVHKFLHCLVSDGTMSDVRAEEFGKRLEDGGRGFDYTAKEFRLGRLGRVGDP